MFFLTQNFIFFRQIYSFRYDTLGAGRENFKPLGLNESADSLATADVIFFNGKTIWILVCLYGVVELAKKTDY